MERLRVFLVLLALAQQAMLAYVSFGRIDPAHYLQSTAPIVDGQRWFGFDLLVLLLDLHLAPLALLVCGLSVWPSLRRYGPGPFALNRLRRMGLPWLAGVLVGMPMAYYLSYRQAGGALDLLPFWRQVLADGLAGQPMPVGPLWFVGLLLVLDGLAALVYRLWPTPVGSGPVGAGPSSVRIFVLLWVVSAVVYLPMRLVFGYSEVFTLGPFSVPASRSLFYALYFFLGVWLGAVGTRPFARDFARQWGNWAQLGALAFVLVLMLELVRLRAWWGAPSPGWQLAYDLACLLTCAATSMAWLAIFQRFALRWLDRMAGQAGGMFLLHGAFGTALQFALLELALPAVAKMLLVLAATAGSGWTATALLQRLRQAAR